MRTKLVTALLMAGTVVGCATSPPPPPPMAMAPMTPPPAPMMVGPVDGVYKGMAELATDAPKGCVKMTRTQTVSVKKSMFYMMGLKGMVGPDGAVTSTPRRGMSVMGTASGTGLDLTAMKGKCSYHYMLNKA